MAVTAQILTPERTIEVAGRSYAIWPFLQVPATIEGDPLRVAEFKRHWAKFATAMKRRPVLGRVADEAEGAMLRIADPIGADHYRGTSTRKRRQHHRPPFGQPAW